MKISNGVSVKRKTLITIAVIVLFVPMFALAQTAGWALGDSYGLPEGTLYGIIEGLLNWLLGIFAFIGIIGFLIAGTIYLLSTGDEAAITRAKNAMIWSIVGIVVGLSGFLIMQAVDTLLMEGSYF